MAAFLYLFNPGVSRSQFWLEFLKIYIYKAKSFSPVSAIDNWQNSPEISVHTECPKKNGTKLNGSVTVIFQLISLKLARLNVKVLNDTHTKNQVNRPIRTCCMRHWIPGMFFKSHPNWRALRSYLLEMKLSEKPGIIKFAP